MTATKPLIDRLVRIGFPRREAQAAIEALGPDATLDQASAWIGSKMLSQALKRAGFRETQPRQFHLE